MGAKEISSDNDFFQSLITEVKYSSSRSKGPGGQNVNKVNTKVDLKFNIPDSKILNHDQKETLLRKLSKKISNDGFLHIYSQEERSQFKNKEIVTEKFIQIIRNALKPVIERKETKPTIASKINRLEEKRKQSIKKEKRKPPELE